MPGFVQEVLGFSENSRNIRNRSDRYFPLGYVERSEGLSTFRSRSYDPLEIYFAKHKVFENFSLEIDELRKKCLALSFRSL